MLLFLGLSRADPTSYFSAERERFTEIIVAGFPLLLAVFWIERPVRFGLCLGAVLLTTALYDEAERQGRSYGGILQQGRSFYTTYRVEKMTPYHRLLHGTTLHGLQDRDAEQRFEALSYYHRTGPIGDVIVAFEQREITPPIAVVGLGTGTMAAHAKPGQKMTFYEIDASVLRVARNPDLFTYVTDAEERGVGLKIVLGDARVQLGHAPDQEYGLIVVDAFSSDAIPIHLLTREALRVYQRKLAPGGIVAFHISNRYLDLEPVIANLAADAGMRAIQRSDLRGGIPGKNGSVWVLVARQAEDFAGIADQADWTFLGPHPETPLWTDDFSNLLSVYRRR
jgi:spermidine synthase